MSVGLPVAATVNYVDNTGAKNLYIIFVKGIKGRLNKLPSTCVGDMVMATVKKGKPVLRKKLVIVSVTAHNEFEDYKESNHSRRTLISISGLFVWTLQVIYLMDKSWINILNRLDPLYENGAKEFLHFASLDRPDASAILCPCRKCRNMKFVQKDLIVEHIVVDGFLTSYTSWIYHGEELFSSKLVNQLDKGDEMQDMLHEAFGIPPTSFVDMDTSDEGFDGFLLCLKNYVRNRRYPEGAIAEGRWIDELMTFCSWYLDDVETKSNPPLRSDVLSNETTDQEGRRSSREKDLSLMTLHVLKHTNMFYLILFPQLHIVSKY
ncbi:hypothetical protein KY290_012510 [Solanum tuberosum]|uniref:Transposase-associated domain-containing protein n=1 Tax=Solanum tuberosum TaxID=4113 RepID=A0ABQ7W3L7_SOLTU|nr:hypothetical protein KY290_012510 [Solanum tuberosum]